MRQKARERETELFLEGKAAEKRTADLDWHVPHESVRLPA